MPQQQSSMPSRRSVAKGAAWTLPILTVAAAAPTIAATTVTALSTDVGVRKVSLSGTGNQAAKTIEYEFRNYGPGRTNLPAAWSLNITQTEGEVAGQQRFEDALLGGAGSFVLTNPVYSTNGIYHVTSQTVTMAQGTSDRLLGREFNLKINFPNSVTRYRDAGWTVTITALFTDTNASNDDLVDLQ